MKVIYLDESGDLGFSERSSKYFIITLLICDFKSAIEVERIPKKIRRNILRKKLKKSPELKGNSVPDYIRKAVLKKLSDKSIEINVIILPKKKVYNYLKNEKNKIYNYATNLILNECSLDDNPCTLIVDRRDRGKLLVQDFNNYISSNFMKRSDCPVIKIRHENSKNEGGLQVVDFISWAIFRKYEWGDSRFYDIIQDKIVVEKVMFE